MASDVVEASIVNQPVLFRDVCVQADIKLKACGLSDLT
jgi:hypothetical protein